MKSALLAAALLVCATVDSIAATAPATIIPKSAAKSIQCVAPRGRSTYKVESGCLNLQYEGQTRTYRLYKSRTAVKGTLPLLFVLHAGGESGSAMEALTLGQFNRIADKRAVLVVYPDGIDRSWNDGRSDSRSKSLQEGVDDIGFLRAVVDRIAEQQPVDRKRIYATGISNGGLMSYRLACDAANFVAAVATVAANLSNELAAECRPTRTVPIAMVSGTDDPMMPWIGGEMKAPLGRRGQVLSAQESFERFMRLGDCALPITHSPRNIDAADGTSVIRHVARECTDGAEVRLYEVLGGGHAWPGGNPGEHLAGKVSREMNASEEIWSFVSRYSLR